MSFVEQLILIKRHRCVLRLNYVIGSSVKANCLNLRQHSRMLLSLVSSLWPERLHMLTKIYFSHTFPQPLPDHDIYLPMLVVDSCMLNVCSSVVWPCMVVVVSPTFYLLCSYTGINYFANQIELELSSLVGFEQAFLLCQS